MGTELAARGVRTSGRSWSAEALDTAPHVVAQIHREYASAGATVHTANTFRTQRRSAGKRWAELAGKAVALARSSVPRGHRVAGAMAPLEDCYRADLSPGEGSRAEHRELAAVLADLGVDLLLCETFPVAIEAAVATREAVRTGVETWVALTAGPGAALMTPEAMRDAARACVAEGAAAVLVNCTPATRTLAYVEALSTAGLGVAVGAYANAGGPEEGIGWGIDRGGGAQAYALCARAWIAAGASIIGGCCGTGPAHVAMLSTLAGRTGS
jgi:S-methylmethionine-dependent homocysteine/selenocysteine methylase